MAKSKVINCKCSEKDIKSAHSEFTHNKNCRCEIIGRKVQVVKASQVSIWEG